MYSCVRYDTYAIMDSWTTCLFSEISSCLDQETDPLNFLQHCKPENVEILKI